MDLPSPLVLLYYAELTHLIIANTFNTVLFKIKYYKYKFDELKLFIYSPALNSKTSSKVSRIHSTGTLGCLLTIQVYESAVYDFDSR